MHGRRRWRGCAGWPDAERVSAGDRLSWSRRSAATCTIRQPRARPGAHRSRAPAAARANGWHVARNGRTRTPSRRRGGRDETKDDRAAHHAGRLVCARRAAGACAGRRRRARGDRRVPARPEDRAGQRRAHAACRRRHRRRRPARYRAAVERDGADLVPPEDVGLPGPGPHLPHAHGRSQRPAGEAHGRGAAHPGRHADARPQGPALLPDRREAARIPLGRGAS